MKMIVLLLPLLILPKAIPAQVPTYLDPDRPTDSRVDDLISRLTIEEKVSQLQDNSVAIPRLQIPAYTWGNEGLHGDAFSGYATLFPQVIGMAATWDTALVHQMSGAIATEARAKFNQANRDRSHPRFLGISFWAPNMNIFRDPRWGRGQETYGEDPFLTARMAVAYVTGLQGDDPHYLKALAGPKHLAVHSGPEAERHRWNSYVSAHDLADTYLPAFRAAIAEAHAGSVMCAYNRINGAPACASPWLLTDTVKQSWGLNGYVVSDCGAVGDLSTGHHYRANDEESSAAALKAGLDLACDWVPDGQRSEFTYLLEAVRHGLVTPEEIDTALRRVLTVRFSLGMFDPPERVPFSSIPLTAIGSPEHAALALKAARESIVLLKNDSDSLPLHHPATIAVIGPSADINQIVEGNYNAVPRDPITPLIGIERRFDQSRILYAQGSPLAEGLPVLIEYTTLHPATGSGEFGLKGEYFSNVDFTGAPVVTRLDRTVNFDWDKAEPAPGMPNENYSVRWSGTFTPPAPGVYSVGAKTRGCANCSNRESFRLFVDGKLVLQSQPPTGAATSNNYTTTNLPKPGTGTTQPIGVSAAGTDRVVKFNFADRSPHTIQLEYIHRQVPTHHLVAGGIDLLWSAPATVLRDQAVQAARDSDVIIACVGLSPELEGEELPIKLPGFLAGDRTDITLPNAQIALLQSLAATGKPLVVILMSGSAVSIPFAQQNAKAILEAWYPGEAGGTAIAETLAGDNNPAGRLPITFYDSVDQLPPFGDYDMANRTYRYFHGKPAFGFGFGLSYAQFEYRGLKLSSQSLAHDGQLTATVKIKNVSKIAGDEVAELYLTPPASPTTPIRRLIGFARVHFAPEEEKFVTLNLTADVAKTITEDGSAKLLAGTYTLFCAGAQPGEATSYASASFQVR